MNKILVLLARTVNRLSSIPGSGDPPQDGLNELERIKRCIFAAPTNQLLVRVASVAPLSKQVGHRPG